jgi:hypothetical protein
MSQRSLIQKEILLGLLAIALAGCNQGNNGQSTAPILRTDNILLSSPTNIVTSTSTKAFLREIIPTIIPDPSSETLLEYWVGGGCGGYPGDEFFNIQKYSIYKTGQIIITEGTFRDIEIRYKQLRKEEIANIFSEIYKTGIYDLDLSMMMTADMYSDPTINPLYKGVSKSQPLCFGCTSYRIDLDGRIFGYPYKYLNINSNYLDYLIPEAKKVLNIIQNVNVKDTRMFYPLGWIVWIDSYDQEKEFKKIYLWPNKMPSISNLLNGHKSGIFIINSKYGDKLMEMQGGRLTYNYYLENMKSYYMIVRPILPQDKMYKEYCKGKNITDQFTNCIYGE